MNSPIFSISPFYAAADKTLGHAAHRVLTLLCGFADPEGLCFPSRKVLCSLSGIENSNLSKYINTLCRKGYLEKVNAAGNRYKIIGFKDKQWPMVDCGNYYHNENQQHGNSYHENISCGNDYHEDGNDYHEDGNSYHKTGDSVVMITNITDQQINRPMEQTNEQTNSVETVASVSPSPPLDATAAVTTENIKPKKSKVDYSPEFDELWSIYPKRLGDNSKESAFNNYKTRRREGYSAEMLLECAKNYRKFCDSEGTTGGRFVKQGSTFLGPYKPFIEYQTPKDSGSSLNNSANIFSIPANKNKNRLPPGCMALNELNAGNSI